MTPLIASRDPSFPRYWFATVDPECRADVSVNEVGDFIETVLADPRGWIAHGYQFFRLSAKRGSALRMDRSNETSVFHIQVSTKAKIKDTCGFSDLSCADLSRNVIYINKDRWRDGAKASGLDLFGYRQYVIQHEVGHLLGRDHSKCPCVGCPRPIMVQATIANDQCTPNPWPLATD